MTEESGIMIRHMIDLFDYAFVFCVVGQSITIRIGRYLLDKELAKMKRLIAWREEIKEYYGWH